MDLELVRSAQRGDEEAFASLAVAVGDRLHAVAHRILRDTDLAEDATQQALLSIWRDLPQLRDPAHFDAWSYRILVRACYAEGRKTRQWMPNLRLLPDDEPSAGEGLGPVVDRDQLERGFRRLSIDHRAVVVLHHYLDMPLEQVAERSASRSGRSDHVFTTRCADCGRPSRPMPARPVGRRSDYDRPARPRASSGRGSRMAWTRCPDRVLDAVLDQVPTTPQRRSAVGVEVPRDAYYRQGGRRAAVLLVIAVVGLRLVPAPGGVGGPAPTASPSPSPSATPVRHLTATLAGRVRLIRGATASTPGSPASRSPFPKAGPR